MTRVHMPTATKALRDVDADLLRYQSEKLAEIADFLTTGTVYATADEWPDAIEGIQNLIAALIPNT